MANPKFDKDLPNGTPVVKSDLSTDKQRLLARAEKRDMQDLSFEEIAGTQQESAQLLPRFEHWGWQAESFAGADVTKRALLDLHSPYVLPSCTWPLMGSSSPKIPPRTQIRMSPNRLRADQTLPGPHSSKIRCTAVAWR